MWAYKADTTVYVEESWYDILFQGFIAFWFAFWILIVAVLFSPFGAAWAAYRQYRYSNCPLPETEVRERAHLG
jgi:hypothetical protein